MLSKDEHSILFIPVNGRKTQWYLNVKKEPEVEVRVGKQKLSGRVTEVGPAQFEEVVDAFTARYGYLKKWYPSLEVALSFPLPEGR